MEWTKIKTKHFLHNDWTLEQKGCLATLLCLVAHLERIPTEKEMIQATHYKSLRSVQEKLKEQSITVQEVFKKVLIDVQSLAKNRVKTNNRVNKHRASKKDVTRYSNKDVTHAEEKRGEENIFNITLNNFKLMRKQLKKPLTEHGETLLLKELDKLAKTEEEKIAILNQSILNSWQGVFPLKENKEDVKPKKPREEYEEMKILRDKGFELNWKRFNELKYLAERGEI